MIRSSSPEAKLERFSGPARTRRCPLGQIPLGDQAAPVAGSHDRRLVDHVGQIGARGAGGDLRQVAQVDVASQWLAARVHLQDPAAPLLVGQIDSHLPRKPPGPKQGRVQHVEAVGGGDDDDALAPTEAVQLGEQLVERRLALVVGAALCVAALAPYGVDLVDEDHGAAIRLAGAGKQLAHAGCADADVLLDEVRAGDGEEGHVRLAGQGLGQGGLAGPRRPVEAKARRHARTDAQEALRVEQELQELPGLLDRLVAARQVAEADLGTLAVVDAGVLAQVPEATPEAQPAPVLLLAAGGDQEEDHRDDDDDSHDPHQDGEPAGRTGVGAALKLDLGAGIAQALGQLRIAGHRVHPGLGAVVEGQGHCPGHLVDVRPADHILDLERVQKLVVAHHALLVGAEARRQGLPVLAGLLLLGRVANLLQALGQRVHRLA